MNKDKIVPKRLAPGRPSKKTGNTLSSDEEDTDRSNQAIKKCPPSNPTRSRAMKTMRADHIAIPAWETQNIFLRWNSRNVQCTFDESKSIHPCKLQYALASKHRNEVTMETLKQQGIFVSKSDNTLEFNVEGEKFNSKKEVEQFVVDLITGTLVYDLECVTLDLYSKDVDNVCERLKENVPIVIKHELVMVFHSDQSRCLYFVGESIKVKDVLKELGYRYDVKNAHYLDKKSWIILEDLEFESYLKEQGVNVKFERVEGDGVKIVGEPCEVRKASKKCNEFQVHICSKKVNFSDPTFALLFYTKGQPSSVIRGYITRCLGKKMKNSRYSFDVQMGSDVDDVKNPIVIVYCRDTDETMAEKITDIIGNDIFRKHSTILKSSEFTAFLEEWKYKEKLNILSSDAKSTTFVCTADISKRFGDLMERSKKDEIPLPAMIVTYLSTHGTDLIPAAAKGLELYVHLDRENNILQTTGCNENIKMFKKNLKQLLVRKSVSVNLAQNVIQKGQEMLDEIVNAEKCCWSPKYPWQLKNTQLLDCKYIATWQHPRGNGNVTLVAGCPLDIKTDCLVLLTNDILYPVCKGELWKHSSYLLAIGREYMESCKNKPPLGDLVERVVDSTTFKNIVNVVVAKVNPEPAKQNKRFDGLDSSFQKIILHALEKRFTSLLVPVSMVDTVISTANVVKSFVHTAVNIQQGESIVELLLCCEDNDEDIDDAFQCVDSAYWDLQQPGYTRKLFTNIVQVSKGSKMLKVKADFGLLHECKAQAIVNTTATDLDLSNGIVSQQILKHAGSGLQAECKTSYPKGIRYGEIAVTGSGNLSKLTSPKMTKSKIKHIFHGALPEYKRDRYITNIKTFVRCCLLEAEMYNISSIAFPALGTGRLGYPRRDVAKAMFDAVEEFNEESINICLQKVKFVVYQRDQQTCEAFFEENIRRTKKSKNCFLRPKQHIPDFPTISGDLKVNGEVVNIKVAVRDDLGVPPSNCVDIVLQNQMGTGEVPRIKRVSSDPKTWHDQLEIPLGAIVIPVRLRFKNAMKICIQQCVADRISEICICTEQGMLNEGEMIEHIANGLLESLSNTQKQSNGPPVCLHTVYIPVQNEAAFENANSRLVKDAAWKDFGKTFLNSISVTNTVIWRKITENEKVKRGVSIELVGRSQQSVEDAEKAVNRILLQVHHSIQAEEVMKKASRIPMHQTDLGLGAIPKTPKPTGRSVKQGDKKFSATEVYSTATDQGINNQDSGVELDSVSKTDVDAAVISNGSKLETTLDVVDDFFDKGHHKLVVPFSEDERESVHFFQEEMDDLTRNVESYQFKNHAIEIICKRKFEKDIGEKIQRLKQRVMSDVQSDEIILETKAEIESGAEACKKAEKQLEGSDLLVLRFGNTIKIKALVYDVLDCAKSIILIATGRRKITQVGRHQRKIARDVESKKMKDSRYVGNINGITVFAYRSSIVDVEVEGIVSAANEYLANTVGVAKLIAKAAGKEEFNNLCKENVKKKGKLQIGECRATSVCKLQQFKHVLHVVGPRNPSYRDPSKMEVEQLTTAIINCLLMADGKGLKSIAIPCISTGTYGFPIDIYSEQYYRALVQFSALKSSLLEVHFVDIEETKIESIRSAFSKMIARKDGAVDTLQDSTARKMLDSRCGGEYDEVSKSTRDSSHIESASQGLEPEAIPFHRSLKRNTSTNANMPPGNTLISSPTKVPYVFNIPDTKVKIIIAEGNITQANVNAVVCTEREDFSGKGAIAQQIMNMAGELYKSQYKDQQRRKHDLTSVTATKADGQLMCHYVLHAVSPHWSCHYIKHNQDFSRDIRLTVLNILTKASELKIQSVAIPFLGTSDAENTRPTLVSVCCVAIADAILHFFTFPRTSNTAENSIMEVRLFSTDQGAIYIWKGEMEKLCKKLPEVHIRNRDSLKEDKELNRYVEIENIPADTTVVQLKSLLFVRGFPIPPPQLVFTDGMVKAIAICQGENDAVKLSCFTGSHIFKFKHLKEQSLGSYTQLLDAKLLKVAHKKREYDKLVDDLLTIEVNLANGSIKTNTFIQLQCAEGIVASYGERLGIHMYQNQKTDSEVEHLAYSYETYDDNLKIKHQFEVKEGKVITKDVVRQRRTLNSRPDVNVPGEQSIGACAKTNCVVCNNSLTDPIVLDCGHVFCRDCITQQFQHRKVCPTCGKVCAIKTGEESRRSMAGLDFVGTVKLEKSTVLDVDAHSSDGVQLIADSDFAGTIKLENTTVSNVDSNSSDDVQLMADSDFAGSIKLENTTVSNVDSNSSDGVHLNADSDFAGTIKLDNTTVSNVDSNSSDDDDDDVSLDNFELILRCVDKDGGCSMKILKAEIGFEALKWRYVFQNQDKRTEFEQKIKTFSATLVCKGESPVAIETNKVLKISTLSKNIKQFIQSETSGLHVEEVIVDADIFKKVIDIMSITSSALTNQSVLRFMQCPHGQTKVWFVGVGKDVLEVLNLFKQTQKYLSIITPSGAT